MKGRFLLAAGVLALASLGSAQTRPNAPREEREDEGSSMPPALVAPRGYPFYLRQPSKMHFGPTHGGNGGVTIVNGPGNGGSPYVAHQVNVDGAGQNIFGDAANEPSITVDPTNLNHITIGWRQFDSVTSNFRQAGNAYSYDGGITWHNNAVLTSIGSPQFRSDPILASSPTGTTYYDSLITLTSNDMWRSADWGKTWPNRADAWGGDKAWITTDQTSGPGSGNIYVNWSIYAGIDPPNTFTRSVDGGLSFMAPIEVPNNPDFGTLAVANDGTLYIGGIAPFSSGFFVSRSSNAENKLMTPIFEMNTHVDLGAEYGFGDVINPGGLDGQVWIATGKSQAAKDHVYLLATVAPFGNDPTAVVFSRSFDRGQTWSPAKEIYPPTAGGAHHWFGTMSVAKNGRIDAVWNDTSWDPTPANPTTTRTVYAYSWDEGTTWSKPAALTNSWAFGVGYPQQNKIGDYYHMISQNSWVSLAFAATLNGEEDVYYMRIPTTTKPPKTP